MIENTRFTRTIATAPWRAVRGAATRLTTMPVRIAIAAIVVLIGLAVAGPPAEAAGTINVKTCDESHLDAAVANTSSGGTVSFSCDGTITLTHTIAIAKTLTLDGSGHAVTLSGGNAVQLLQVTSSGNLTVNHLTLTAGNAWEGGAIENEGNLTVSGSTFTKNYAGGSGGAIFSDAPVTVTNSVFNHNSTGYGGGAIWAITTLNVSNTLFNGNTAGGGGAIDSESLNWSKVATISGAVFTNNSAGGEGGAIYNDYGTMSISNSVIGLQGAGNTAYNGGAIENYDRVSITGSTMEYNSATGLYGGGVDTWGPLSISGSTIAYNSAASDGGGIWIGDWSVVVTPVATTIVNNTPNNCSGQTNTGIVVGCSN